ncbi:MAG TPA: DMT family transporter [Dehalococcoidia bacterium]|jgi:drug/metabolite transporter (DMT)-like permease|nr:DMT family transporter [Dehalococcoidia bacterium]
MNSRSWLVLAAGIVAISWAAPLIRLTEAPAIVIASLRLTIAAPPVLAVALVRRRGELRAVTRADVLLLMFAGVALAGHFAFWVASVQRTSIVTSVVLVTMQPPFVSLGGWIFLREPPSRGALVAIAVATAGALLLASGDLGDRGSLSGDLFAVIGAALASAYIVAGRRVRGGLSNLSYMAVVNTVAAAVLLLMLLASGSDVSGYSREVYLLIVLLTIGPQLIGHSSLNWALGFVPAVVVAIAILGEPVGATLIAATLLDEVPTLLEWIGSAVVLLGVYIGLSSPTEPQQGRAPIEL